MGVGWGREDGEDAVEEDEDEEEGMEVWIEDKEGEENARSQRRRNGTLKISSSFEGLKRSSY